MALINDLIDNHDMTKPVETNDALIDLINTLSKMENQLR